MAKIIGNPETNINIEDGEELYSLADPQEDNQESAPAQEQYEEEDDVPDKYRGKSLKDIVQMHQEAEKLLGRQSSEVGELRKVVDDFVKGQLATQSPRPAQPVEEEVDFFDNPQKAVERAIENHPTVKQAQQAAASMRQQEAINALKTAHPDFQTILQDEGFAEWVKKSKIRQQLFVAAHKNFDFDAADELLSSWKERAQVVRDTVETEKQSRKQQVKSASTGNVSGSGESPARKIYRRADIIKLMQTDPERYMALAGEIRTAYAEGRVK